MPPTVHRLIEPPVLFAQRGAARHAEADSLEAHALAVRLGATGVLTRASPDDDGEVVLGRGRRGMLGRLGVIGGGRRRQAPVGLDELYTSLGRSAVQLALIVGDTEVALDALETARRRGGIDRLWLCSADLDLLLSLRSETPASRLLHRCVPMDRNGGAERHADRLRRAGIDGALVPEDRVSAGMVALLHRFTRLVVAERADHPRTARRGLGHGVDGIAGADVEALRDALDADRPDNGRSEPGDA